MLTKEGPTWAGMTLMVLIAVALYLVWDVLPSPSSEYHHKRTVDGFHRTMHDAKMPHSHPMPAARKVGASSQL